MGFAMQTARKRIHFQCPACGHEQGYALKITEAREKNQYLCEKCGAVSTPKNYMFVNVFYGALLGAITGLLAYWLFKQYMFNSPPVFAILAATPIALIVSWMLMPLYSKLFYRWALVKGSEEPN